MKTISYSKNPKNLSLSIFAFILLAISFTSCSKDDSSNNVFAYVKVTNSAEASAPQDFYIDNTKVSGTAMAYGQSSDFISIGSGSHQAAFKNSATSTTDATLSLTLAAGKFYSVFYVDGNSTTSYQDDRTAPQAGKARVRFINLSSALSSSVDFGASGGAKLASDIAYKAASTYYDVDAATAFSLYASGSSSVLLDIPAGLQAGHIYTIYISGAATATIVAHVVAEN